MRGHPTWENFHEAVLVTVADYLDDGREGRLRRDGICYAPLKAALLPLSVGIPDGIGCRSPAH